MKNPKKIKKEIAKRKKSCRFRMKDGRTEIFTTGTRKLFSVYEKEYAGSGDGGIKGIVAYPGLVRGKVKIIKSGKEINDLSENKILVTLMTSPDYISAMKKAKAIITDDGGLTCHAAIVARELKKPCIVGTRNATKLLKDGDLIEVDAVRGIVRKISI